NPQQLCMRLLRRELERGGPAWKFGRGSEALAPRQIVDLDHDAVGVEVERAPFVGPFAAELRNLVDARAALPVRLDRQPPRGHRAQRVGVRGGKRIFSRLSAGLRRAGGPGL